jgi:flagellar biosynthesis protein FlhB
VALKIKEKAMELKIEIIEDKPLAQAMYAAVEIGQEIPQEFYVAIAKILAEIYSVRRR